MRVAQMYCKIVRRIVLLFFVKFIHKYIIHLFPKITEEHVCFKITEEHVCFKILDNFYTIGVH